MSFNKVYHMALMQLLLLSGTTALAKERFKLLPTPKKVEWRSNKGIDWYELRSICLVNGSLRPWLAYPLNNMPQTNKGGKGVLTLKIVKDKSVPDNAEAYVLEVKIGEVVIRAREQKGLFYGCQTLLQLLEDGRDQQVHIPVVTITDYPDIPYRSIHLDIKYHLDNMNYYYQMIDRLAQVKVNGIMVEFEDKLKYRNAALVGSDNAISVDEFAALTRYAAERYIEISPLVQGLGHASFILKHDKYHTLRDDPKVDWVMDPLQPGTYELLYRMYDDAIDATPGAKYLHIGGDEVYNLGQSELSRKSGMKPFELQMYWLNKVCEYARLHNRIPVFWDDMIFNMAEVYMSIHDNKSPADSINLLWQKRSPQLDEYLHLFPNDCIYMRWHYSYPKVQGNLNAVKWFKERGLRVMGASAVQDMSAMLPRKNSLYQPMKDFSEVAAAYQLEGMLATIWDDSSPHFETFWRGIYDYASLSWNYIDVDHNQAHQLFRHRFYAPELSSEKFEIQDSLELALSFWDTAFLISGDRSHFPYNPDFMGLPHNDSIGVWSVRHADKIDRSIMELRRYAAVKKIAASANPYIRRNHYNMELLLAINELQIYPARLIHALHKYDKAKASDKQKQKQLVKELVDNFPEYRKAYESVFSKTRFLNNPPGYILDQNNDRLLANGTNNSDWLFAMELEFNNRVLGWLMSN